MAPLRKLVQLTLFLVGLFAAGCGSAAPTLLSDETAGAAVSTTTTTAIDAVADDSPPTLDKPSLGELVQSEFVLGGVWGLDQNDILEDEARFSFHGSQIEPKVRIESRCGVGNLEFEPRLHDAYRISSSSWNGCEGDPLRSMLETAGGFTASTNDQFFDSLPMQIGTIEFELSLLDGRSSFTVTDDGYPFWNLDHDETQQPEENLRTPVPELTASVIAAEPLLTEMTWLKDSADLSPDRLQYISIIGWSQYLLVDETGEPQAVRGGDANKLQLMITAYHGAEKPVVYVAFMNHYSQIDSEYGPQSSGCDGGMFLGGLIAHPDGEYEFADQIDQVFENQIQFGDYECGGVDLNPWPEAFEGRFRLDASTDGILVMQNENGASARFLLLEPDSAE